MSYCGESSMFWSPLQSRACLIDGSFSAGFTRMGERCWRIHLDSSSVSIVTHISVIGHIYIFGFQSEKSPQLKMLMLLSISAFVQEWLFLFPPLFSQTSLSINLPLTADGNNNIHFPALPKLGQRISEDGSEEQGCVFFGSQYQFISYNKCTNNNIYTSTSSILLLLQLLINQMVKVFILDYDLIKNIVSLCSVNVVSIWFIIIGDLHSLPMIVCAFLTISANS